MTRIHAVIPAAGRGVRFGSRTNKIFESLLGRPLVEWTLDAVQPTVDAITIAAAQEDIDRLKSMVAQDNVRIVVGGSNRQESVWNALQTVDGSGTIVLVHDAARPVVTREVIDRCVESAKVYGSGVAAMPIFDALKRTESGMSGGTTVVSDLDREGVWAMQTPQAFRRDILREAHRRAQADGFVGLDDASLVQRIQDQPVHLVRGDRRNMKITTPEDLVFAEQCFAESRTVETRTGIGYDIHRLAAGRPLWLGGVLIPFEQGLYGHSDADVVIHAICDSLLGAAGLPDIGHLFPNNDERYRGISSVTLLASVREELRRDNWLVGNIDTMLIAEAPHVAPHIPQMRLTLAEALKAKPELISIKATTNEGIGSLGAGDGIACHSVANIVRFR